MNNDGQHRHDSRKVIAVIQARLGSRRLPNKVLLPLSGVPALEFLLHRLQRSRRVDEIVVATGSAEDNKAIVDLCKQLGTRFFAGSENDVLDRFWQITQMSTADYVARITGDCPLFDPGLLDEAINQLKAETDYLGMMSETYPDGLDLEIINRNALQTAWREATLPSEREHVTPFIKNNPQRFSLQDFVSPIKGLGSLRWTLDEPEDYQFITKVVDFLMETKRQDFDYLDVLSVLDEYPELSQINKHIERNEGLQESYKLDQMVIADLCGMEE